MKALRPLLPLVLILWTAPVLRAQSDSLFHKATDAYNEGAFQQAADHYLEILENGRHSAALYYNLGNTYYKMGQIAPSIYYYEKGLLLSPGDPEILNNLAYAENMTLDAIQPLPRTDISRFYQRILNLLHTDQWAYAGIAFMILFVLGFLAFYQLRSPNQKRIALIAGLVFLALSIFSTSMAYLQYQAYLQDQPAIVFRQEVSVRAEPNPGAPEAFRLHEGTKVQVRDSLGDWRKILLADGQTGWMPVDDMRLLKDF